MSTLELDLSALEPYSLDQLRAFCKERGLHLRKEARKAEYQKALTAYEEAHRVLLMGLNEEEGEEDAPREEGVANNNEKE